MRSEVSALFLCCSLLIIKHVRHVSTTPVCSRGYVAYLAMRPGIRHLTRFPRSETHQVRQGVPHESRVQLGLITRLFENGLHDRAHASLPFATHPLDAKNERESKRVWSRFKPDRKAIQIALLLFSSGRISSGVTKD